MSNFIKFRPVGAELFHADKDREREKTKFIAIRTFANVPAKNPYNK